MKFLKNKVKERAVRMGKYHEIIALLSREFFWDDMIEQACMKTLVSHDGKFDESFEFIVDNPSMAQFRLKWGDGFRLSYYPFSRISDEKEQLAERITEKIRKIENG